MEQNFVLIRSLFQQVIESRYIEHLQCPKRAGAKEISRWFH